jgi:hypothetical protein
MLRFVPLLIGQLRARRLRGTVSLEYIVVAVLLVVLVGVILLALATTIWGRLNGINADLGS